MPAFRPPLFAFLHRAFAVGCASMVLALAIFAASPGLHEELHHGDHGNPHDESCAIALFAGGIALPLAELAHAPRPSARAAATLAAHEQIAFASPRFLHPPERGPPRGLN